MRISPGLSKDKRSFSFRKVNYRGILRAVTSVNNGTEKADLCIK